MPALQPTIPTLVAVRADHHSETTPKYDRIVFEFNGSIPYLRIEYVESLMGDGSGAPIQVAGKVFLLVQFTPARAHNDRGQITAPTSMKFRKPLIKEIVRAGDFESVVTYGIGLARKAETRILTMGNASRVVIDLIL
jgi:hypothetical protein